MSAELLATAAWLLKQPTLDAHPVSAGGGVRVSRDLLTSSQQHEAEVDALIRKIVAEDRAKEQDRRSREQASQEWVRQYLDRQNRVLLIDCV